MAGFTPGSYLIVLLCCTTKLNNAAFQYGRIFINDLEVEMESEFNNIILSGRLGTHMTSRDVEHTQYQRLPNGVSITWPGVAYVTITESDLPTKYDVTCQDVMWVADDCRVTLFEDCYSMIGAHWYGGAPIRELTWPIEKWDRQIKPFVSGDAIGADTKANSLYSGVLERYWLNSDGVGIYVGSETPLWISLNSTGDQEICFRATYEESPYMNYDKSPLFLNYTVCQGLNAKETQLFAIENFLGKPIGIPDEMLFRYPIYSTWARYHANITQDIVIDFAKEINYYNYSNAQMEIDDDWESSYGQLDFDPEKFPDPKAMVNELTGLGFRTTVWVHPFVNIVSPYFLTGGLQFVYLKDPGGLLPGLTIWWNGIAATIDFTDLSAVDWWMENLQDLRDNYNISSFKFDAGETNWLPGAYLPNRPFRNPCDYTTNYVEIAYLADQEIRHQEVRAAYRNQNLPVFVRLLDKYSRWDYDNGLRSVIPHVLLFSIIGYVFPLPDMIGGNAYSGRFPDRELFIRWTQLNAFLPGFQFSIVPWQYDNEVVELCREMLLLHESYADFMIELAHNATLNGQPIIRPLWWIAPNDVIALEIDSEFLLGNDLLVAPVVYEGAVSRDVYLPAGRWRDMNNPANIYDGGSWYYDFPAPLNLLPYFFRIG